MPVVTCVTLTIRFKLCAANDETRVVLQGGAQAKSLPKLRKMARFDIEND